MRGDFFISFSAVKEEREGEGESGEREKNRSEGSGGLRVGNWFAQVTQKGPCGSITWLLS